MSIFDLFSRVVSEKRQSCRPETPDPFLRRSRSNAKVRQSNIFIPISINRYVKVEFECIICGETASATVSREDVRSDDGPTKTLRDCPHSDIETIWMES